MEGKEDGRTGTSVFHSRNKLTGTVPLASEDLPGVVTWAAC